MTLRLLQIDTFTDRVLGGNPAAVCPLDAWLDEDTMQAIAAENNLSETAFMVPEGAGYRLRWFTPNVEVDLCGHATLAAAFVVFEELRPGTEQVAFETLSGRLTVARQGADLVMDFPAQPARPVPTPPLLAQALGTAPAAVLAGADYVATLDRRGVFENAAPRRSRASAPIRRCWRPSTGAGSWRPRPAETGTARTMCCVFSLLFHSSLGHRIGKAHALALPLLSKALQRSHWHRDGGVKDTSSQVGVRSLPLEDPVTGNVQTALVPYWAGRLGKRRLAVRQLSARGGRMVCEDHGTRVTIAGQAVRYMDATVSL